MQKKNMKALLLSLALFLPVFPFNAEGIHHDARVLDCPEDAGSLAPSRTVMQVIDGVFHKWREYDAEDGGFFIFREEPGRAALAAREAEGLLEKSSAWEGKLIPPNEEAYTLDPDDPVLNLPADMPVLDEFPAPRRYSAEPDAEAPPVDLSPPAGELFVYEEEHVYPQVVIGEDERVRVPFSVIQTYPRNTIGITRQVFPNHSQWRASGFLVAPHTILTNAHVLYNSERGGWINSLVFSPAQFSEDHWWSRVHRPYGSRYAVRAAIPSIYVEKGGVEYDYGAFFIEKPFSGLTTFMPVVFDHSPTLINTSGYPGSAHGISTESQWWSYGDIHDVGPRVLRYYADTSGGQCGSPVWIYMEVPTPLRRVVGIHARGWSRGGVGLYNGGPRMVFQNKGMIENWMRWAPYSTLTVKSLNPVSGVNIAVWPADKDGLEGGATEFTRRYPHNRAVFLHAPLAAGGNEFSHWLVDGRFHSFERNIVVGMDRSKEMTAVYAAQERTLTVESQNPSSGVNIAVWPPDRDGLRNGSTGFTRRYPHNRVVELHAPLTAGGNEFSHWLVDGRFHSFERNIRVGMDRSKEMTAVYAAQARTLTVESQNPSSGVNIAVWPPDRDGLRNGSTGFTRRYPHNRVVELHAPLAAGGNEFSHWLVDGRFHSFERNIRVGMDRSKEMTAAYRP